MSVGSMDERCAAAHARLLAGTCPWCGRAIINGGVSENPLGSVGLGSACEIVTDLQFTEVGTSLKDVIEQEGTLDWRRAAMYIAEVGRQLVDIHVAQQVHGNVQPDNIYLDRENSAELGNNAQELMYGSTNEESISSLVDCLAPERAINSSEVDGRADVYSLGCTFYFLLAGRMPFPSGSVSERLLQHQTGTPESLSVLRPDVPRAVVAVCEKMMAKKPNDRYATAKDVVDVLAKMQAEG
jgi:eukaryotic-like serine/threonine-protein kinase